MIRHIFTAFAALILFTLPACDEAATPHDRQGLPTRQVHLISADGNTTLTVLAEVAATNSARSQGLMFRQHLPEGRGMLFVWPTADLRHMWMKNTYIPLDMVFAHGPHIVGLIHNARPLSLDHLGPSAPSNQVLELPAGTLKRHGITKSWKLVDQPAP